MTTQHKSEDTIHTSQAASTATSSRTYGWRRQLPDRRDHKYVPPSAKLPSSCDLRETGFIPDVYDQGKLGSCTANAIAGAFHYNEKKSGYSERAEFVPSRLFIYYNERAMEGHVSTDSGAQIRDGIKSVNTTGVCHEAQWPYDIATFTEKPPVQCYEAALNEKALKYQCVPQTEEAIKHALASEQQPVAFGFTVYESFESPEVARTGVMPMPEPHEKALGGHAVLCVGYDDSRKSFIVRNSWSDKWGMKGYFLMPYEFMTSADSASDFWIIETISRVPAAKGADQYDVAFPALPVPKPTDVQRCTEDKHEESTNASALRLTGSLGTTGTTFMAGEDVNITWETNGPVSSVRIMFCINSWSGMLSSWTTIAEAPNSGHYKWTLPANATIDQRYWIRLVSSDECAVSADSQYFSVTAPVSADSR